MFDNKLPNELISCVYEFYNPYKYIYNIDVVLKLKYKHIYSSTMRELNNYNVRYRNKEIIYFQKYAILTSVNDTDTYY
jgi:hypothetical protein